jgi:hypothetical protein
MIFHQSSMSDQLHIERNIVRVFRECGDARVQANQLVEKLRAQCKPLLDIYALVEREGGTRCCIC